jgi:hypothetical protein
LRHTENEKCIEDYVERETAWARNRIEDAEAAIRQEQEDIEAAENTGVTTRVPKKSFHVMIIAIGDSQSNIACSEDGEDGDDYDDNGTERGQLSEDDKPGWAMGTITKTVLMCMEMFWL